MFVSRTRGQDNSPGIPARWMTASAPWQAAVTDPSPVTDGYQVTHLFISHFGAYPPF